MKTYYQTFIHTLLYPSYYKDILKYNFSFSIKYYMLLTLLLTLLSTVVGVFKYAPAIKSDFSAVSQEILQRVPQDLIVTISPDGITSNRNFPLVAKTPDALRKSGQKNILPKNLILIDPNGEVGMLKEFDALILINNSYFIVGSDSNLQTTELKDLPQTVIDYPLIQQLTSGLSFIAKHSYLFTALFFFLGGMINFFIYRVIYLAFFALILLVIHRKVLGTYSKSFQIGLHSITLPLLISTLFEIVGVTITAPLWFLVIHTLVTFYMLRPLEKTA